METHDDSPNPNLRIINVVDSVTGYEAFDIKGNRVRFPYPTVKNSTTCGCFTLGGYNSIFVIYAENNDYILDFSIKAVQPKTLNPYVPGKYKLDGIPVLEIKPVSGGDLQRIVYSPFAEYAAKIRAEYLSQEYKSCSSQPVVNLTQEVPWQVVCQADIRQITSAEQFCETALEIVGLVALVAAVIVSGGEAAEALTFYVEEIVAQQSLVIFPVAEGAAEISEIIVEDASFLTAGLSQVNAVSDTPFMSLTDLVAGMYEFPPTQDPLFCLGCNTNGIYADLGFIGVPIGLPATSNYIKYQQDTRTFYITKPMELLVHVDIRLNFLRRSSTGKRLFIYPFKTYCGEGETNMPFFSFEYESCGARRYLENLDDVNNPHRVKSGKTGTYFAWDTPLDENGNDMRLQVTYRITSDPGYQNTNLHFTIYNGAVLMREDITGLFTALSTNMQCRDYEVNAEAKTFRNIRPTSINIKFEPV